MKLNQDGSSTLVASMLLLVIVGFTIYHFFTLRETTEEIQVRAQNYLCMANFVKSNKTYIKRNEQLNTTITTMNILLVATVLTPPQYKAVKYIKKATIWGQNLFHAKHIISLSQNKTCHKLARAAAFQVPLQTTKGLMLKRDIYDLAIFKDKWDFIIPSPQLAFKGKYIHKEEEKKKWQLKEISEAKDLLRLKLSLPQVSLLESLYSILK